MMVRQDFSILEEYYHMNYTVDLDEELRTFNCPLTVPEIRQFLYLNGH